MILSLLYTNSGLASQQRMVTFVDVDAGYCRTNRGEEPAVSSGCYNQRSVTLSYRNDTIHVGLVPDAEKQTGSSSPWFVFNDFVVRNISEEEALHFPDTWKVCIIPHSQLGPLKFSQGTCRRVPRTGRYARQTGFY
jgi:hypothetical protein